MAYYAKSGVNFSVYIPLDVYDQMMKLMDKNKLARNKVVVDALREYFANKVKKNEK